MNEVWMIVGMTIVTFGARYPVLALLSRNPLPKPLFKALKFVPPAVLSAIILPAVLMPTGVIELEINNAPLIAGSAAMLVAWRSRSLLVTIVLGMLVLWGWRGLFPI
jgi:branched-subunit amino acid transport protein